MNHEFSGTLLLSIILVTLIVLFTLALIKKPKLKNSMRSRGLKNTKNAKSATPKFRSKVGEFSKASNTQLKTLKKRVVNLFPSLNATVKNHHLMLKNGSKKVAMLTLDKNAALGRRKLGDITVINFHSMPSKEELKIELIGMVNTP